MQKLLKLPVPPPPPASRVACEAVGDETPLPKNQPCGDAVDGDSFVCVGFSPLVAGGEGRLSNSTISSGPSAVLYSRISSRIKRGLAGGAAPASDSPATG